jgi:hypothetical protein
MFVQNLCAEILILGVVIFGEKAFER